METSPLGSEWMASEIGQGRRRPAKSHATSSDAGSATGTRHANANKQHRQAGAPTGAPPCRWRRCEFRPRSACQSRRKSLHTMQQKRSETALHSHSSSSKDAAKGWFELQAGAWDAGRHGRTVQLVQAVRVYTITSNNQQRARPRSRTAWQATCQREFGCIHCVGLSAESGKQDLPGNRATRSSGEESLSTCMLQEERHRERDQGQ